MAYDESLALAIRQELARQLDPAVFEETVAEKKMFGGLAFMIRGKMCMTVSDDPGREIMIRIAPKDRERLIEQLHAQATEMKGRVYKGYLDLDRKRLEDLPVWVTEALAFNEILTC